MNTTQNIAEFYKAISDPVRIDILKILLDDCKTDCNCICHFADKLSKDQSVIYRHIQILKKAGLIDTVKKDKFLHCCIKDPNYVQKLLKVKL